jgi:hypothetical protein
VSELGQHRIEGGTSQWYIIQASARDGRASLTVADRKEALATGIRWASPGFTKIKIIGDGRIYTPEELAVQIINDDTLS